MATETPSRPGMQVGPTSEFSLFFRVKPGHGRALRERARRPAEHARLPARRLRHGDRDHPRGAVRPLRRRHPAAVRDQLRRPVGRLHGGLLHVRADARSCSTSIFRHVEGYDGLPDLAAVKTFILGAQQTAAAYARNYGGTVKEIRKAQRVNAAFQQVLDDPGGRGAAAPGAAAAARRGRGLAGRADEPRASADVRSHLRARAPWPTRSPTSPTSTPSRARSGPGASSW